MQSIPIVPVSAYPSRCHVHPVGARPGAWIAAHLVEFEINLVGAIDVEAA